MAPGDDPIGRDAELARGVAFLDDPSPGARALVIEGEPGIGKTTLWRALLDVARADGHTVLVAQPSEDELPLGLVALRDLFEGVSADPAITADGTDVFDRGRAVLAALRSLSDGRAPVVAVDDAQWLDVLSRRTLRFAHRRIEVEPLRVVATCRPSAEVTDLLDGDRVERIPLAPLGPEALRRVVAPVSGTLSRPALGALHELSGGNPMYALELARLPPERRATAGTLRDAVAERLADAPAGVVGVVRTAAALGPRSPSTLLSAASASSEDMAMAFDLGLVGLADDMHVRVAHPLLAAVALAEMAAAERAALHARLAGLADGADARAHHLALATSDRDEPIARLVEEAADRAGRQGAPATAAELAAHSLRLTPVSDRAALARRAVAEILHRAAAGETGRAVAMIDAIVGSLPPGRERFAALALRVGLDFGRAEEVLAPALADDPDELTRGRILDLLAYAAYMYHADLARGDQLAAAAREIAVRHADPDLEMLASATLATVRLLAGQPEPALLDRALELGRASGAFRLGRWPEVERARQCIWAGELAEARALLDRLAVMAQRSGLEFQRPFRLVDLAALELASGNLADAARLAGDGVESGTEAGNGSIVAWLRYPQGLAAAHLGDDDGVSVAVAGMRAWGTERGEPPRLLMAHHVAGVHELSRGRAARALAELRQGVEIARAAGQAHPGVVAVVPDALEAAAAIGDAPMVRQLSEDLQAQADALGLPWVDAAARRGAAFAARAGGDVRAALSGLAASIDAFDELGYRLDAARTTRWHGLVLRRAGRRGEADSVLTDARERLRAIGARPWIDLLEERVDRALTTNERHVVDLVVGGRRNRDIASDLHVSEATVEATLTRIYRAVGVRSRVELARWAGAEDQLARGVSDR